MATVYDKEYVYIIQQDTDGTWRINRARGTRGANFVVITQLPNQASYDQAIAHILSQAEAVVGESNKGSSELAVTAIIHVPYSELLKATNEARKRIFLCAQDTDGTWRRGVAIPALDANTTMTHGTAADYDTLKENAISTDLRGRVLLAEVHFPAHAFNSS